MTEVHYAMWATALEAAAKDNVCFAFDYRLNHQRELFWVVFEVGILNDANNTGCFLENCSQGLTLALIDFLKDHSNLMV